MTLKLDITKALVTDGIYVGRTIDAVITHNGVMMRATAPLEERKPHGIYDFYYEEPNPPEGKKTGDPTHTIDAVAGTVTQVPSYVDLTALEQIAALEKSITERRKREAILTDAGRDWLTAKDADIAALRGQLR
ncbi:MAG: hypothetical protein V4641_03420 [Pseudomonadota bacterium]